PGRSIPGMRYSFQYGFPYTNPLLASSWARALAHAAEYTFPGYPATQGMPGLRQAVCDYLAQRRGVLAASEDVVIVMGTQQAIALTARVLLNPGDAVAIEDPQYFAISEVLQVHGARLLPVPVDGEGLRCDALPQQSPRLICVTPSHQFPTGALMSLPRRLALLEYARRHDCWIFEDDYDGEFRYDSQPHAALRSLDEDRRVIYVGSFSKVLFPALRMGYLVVPPSLRRDFVAAKWVEDFGSPAIEQSALAHFMADGSFERHLRRTAKTLKQRRTVLLDGLRRHAGEHIDIADSHAGMHLVVWLRGRDAAQGEALIAHAALQGLGLYSIAPYYLQPPDRAGLLMGFGGLSVAEIEAATELFGRCLRET
ncbi:MAG: PLP-dependent aminotransferase family protein, partial [Lysobacter sp.]